MKLYGIYNKICQIRDSFFEGVERFCEEIEDCGRDIGREFMKRKRGIASFLLDTNQHSKCPKVKV